MPLTQRCTGGPCPPLRAEKAKLQRLKTDGAAAAAAYGKPGQRTPPKGYHEATDAELRQMNLSRAMLQNPPDAKGKPTGFQAAVFVADNDNARIVAFKGTESGEDWGNNLEQGAGMDSNYYTQAQKIGTKVAGSPEAGNTHFTGHSLGGGLAAAAAKRGGMSATTFNAATVNDGTVDQPNAAARIEPVSVRGDPLTRANEGLLGTTGDTETPYKLDPPDNMTQKTASTTPWWNLKEKGAAFVARQKAMHSMDTANAALAKREGQVDAAMKANRC